MEKQYILIKELPKNTEFVLNGLLYKKRSSKTIGAIGYKHWFYFTPGATGVVGKYSRLALNYFN